MKRTPLSRKSPIKRGGRVKPINPKRRQSEFARTYHSKARVAWVASLACVAIVNGRQCGVRPCDNCHTESGGAGRKADYATIIPMCRAHHRLQHAQGWEAVGLGGDLRHIIASATQRIWEEIGAEAD